MSERTLPTTSPTSRHGTKSGSISPSRPTSCCTAKPAMMQRKTTRSVRISELRVTGSGGGAVSERPTGFTSPGSSEVSPPRSIRTRPIGPPITAATTRPSVAMAMPISGPPARPRAASSGDQAMIVPWPPRSEVDPSTAPSPSGNPAIQAPRKPTRFCRRSSTAVSADEDAERPAALDEVGEPGVEPDAGEEDQQQQVAGVGVEADLGDAGLVEQPEAEGDQKAAGDRVGDVEAAQERHAVVDRLADQVGHQPEGDGHEVGKDDLLHAGPQSKRSLSWRQR